MRQDNDAVRAEYTAKTIAATDTGMPVITLNDLDYDLARRAHEGTSFVPEDRAVSEQAGYVGEMIDLWNAVLPFITDANRVDVVAAWERYRADWLRRNAELLHSHSRIVSTMIAGPSGFPVRQMNKRNDAYHNKVQAFLDWRVKARAAILKQFAPADPHAPISSTDPDAAAKLQAKLDALEATQARMIAANKLVRKNDRAGLLALGFGETHIDRLLDPAQFGGPGFARFELTNNRANIKRVQERLAALAQAAAVQETTEAQAFPATDAHPAGELFIEEERVQLKFEERTSREFYDRLRSAAFIWSPSRGTFVRKYTPAALAAARQLVGVK